MNSLIGLSIIFGVFVAFLLVVSMCNAAALEPPKPEALTEVQQEESDWWKATR